MEIVEGVIQTFGLGPATVTPGRAVVRHIGESLVRTMEMALEAGNPKAAELVAAECVTLAETKDHLNTELLGETSKKLKGDEGKSLNSVDAVIEEQEDDHLYHCAGWGGELWIRALGMPAVLPPPGEQKDVKTAIGAARGEAGSRFHDLMDRGCLRPVHADL